MRNLLVSASVVLAALASARAELESATPESQGVPSAAIQRWLDACERRFDGEKDGRLHGFVLLRHGKTIAEGSWKPHDTLNEPAILYSHSKSFISTAVGFLVDEGRLDLDERVLDIFPEEAPPDPSENLRALRVRDLLTMNVGADQDHVISHERRNWLKAFLAKTLEHRPGTRFRYDSDATYALAAIVEKRSGEHLVDFLKTRLFDPIGIEKASSSVSPEGIACGGWGMAMTTRDLARFGQFCLQKGAWNGRRLLSSDWFDLATTRQTWSGPIRVSARVDEDGDDWHHGYGFQFWRCRHNAYRADGAWGKFTVVLPEQDAVLSIHAGILGMQDVLDLIWAILLPAMESKPLPADPASSEALARRCADLAIEPIPGGDKGVERFFGTYVLDANARGFRAVELTRDESGTLHYALAGRGWPYPNPVGVGAWTKGSVHLEPERYERLGGIIGCQPTASSAGVQSDGSLKISSRLTGLSGELEFVFSEVDGRLTVTGGLRHVIGAAEFGGTIDRADPAPYAVPPVVTDAPWAERRAEILKFFTETEFGVRPVERPADLAFETSADVPMLGGKGVRRDIVISCMGPFGPFAFTAHAYLPKGAQKVASFVSISLGGNLQKQNFVFDADDPSILALPVRDILTRGHAVVMFSNWDVARDDPSACFTSGVFRAFGPKVRGEHTWGALSAWAWGASRVRDWIATQPEFDSSRVGVVGHSRGGKTALWAGVTDDRFALVCVNDSGCAGAKLNRMRLHRSEHYASIVTVFPHWFAPAFEVWADRDDEMPFDAPHLLSLVAPRVCEVGSGTQDFWAGPEGELASARLAAPAWENLGAGGFGSGVRHHFREGPHGLLPFDWARYMDAMETLK